eukprot:Skav217987  [mRNA]  locus=scaffold496:522630:523830:+ [translate_table: standard]
MRVGIIMLWLGRYLRSALKAAYNATCLVIHPDKNEHPDATRAQTYLNESMTVLESAIARSEYNHSIRNKLEKAAEQTRRKRQRSQLGAKLRPHSREVHVKSKQTNSASGGASKQAPSKEPAADNKVQEPSLSSKAAEATSSKQPAEQAGLKWWDVSGLQVRQYKLWVAVRLNNALVRKFLFKEWQDETVAMQVATELAKKAAKQLFEFRFAKNKKDKAAFLTTNGVEFSASLTVVQLQSHLEQAGQR